MIEKTFEERRAEKQAKKLVSAIIIDPSKKIYVEDLLDKQKSLLKLIMTGLLLGRYINSKNTENIEMVKFLIFLIKAPESLQKNIISFLLNPNDLPKNEKIHLSEKVNLSTMDFYIKKRNETLICECTYTKKYGLIEVLFKLSALKDIIEIIEENIKKYKIAF